MDATAVSVVIQTDASSGGLGSCLLQNGQPVAYALRALTNAEMRYAQIERVFGVCFCLQ